MAKNPSVSSLAAISRRDFLRCIAGTAACLLYGCHSRVEFLGPVQGKTGAERAVNAAKQFAGHSIKVGWESGPQARGLMAFEAPLWEKLTGIRVNVVEMGVGLSWLRHFMQEAQAKTGALDCVSLDPAWVPELLRDQALEPLDDYVAHYMPAADLADYLPLYRDLGTWDDHRYGLFDDGDSLVLFYRKDLFGDPANQKEFAAKYGYPLGDPRKFHWRQFIEAARFFNEKYAPSIHALSPLSRELCWALFQNRLRIEGGEFFDPNTMKCQLDSAAGQRAFAQLQEALKITVPTAGMEPSIATSIASFLSGACAMAVFWPPLGRWAERSPNAESGFSFVPQSQVAGKTGYSLLPDGITEMTVGFMLSILKESRKKLISYLFIQWLNSPEMSLRRVMRSDNLRDPFRLSHVDSKEYRSSWPTAGDYLNILKRAGSGAALLDLMIPNVEKYTECFYVILTKLRLGAPGQIALQELTRSWDKVTAQCGRERQREGYASYLTRFGAMLPKR